MATENILCILPVYNEEETVWPVIDFARWLYQKRIIESILIVNDASTDKSQMVILQKKRELQSILSLNVVVNSNNKGKWYALRQWYEEAKKQGYKILFIMDTDLLELPQQWFADLLEPLNNGEYMRILPHSEWSRVLPPHSVDISGERIIDIRVIDSLIDIMWYERVKDIIIDIRFGLEEFLNYIVEKIYGKSAIDIIEYNVAANYPLAKIAYKWNDAYQERQLLERKRFRGEVKRLLDEYLQIQETQ